MPNNNFYYYERSINEGENIVVPPDITVKSQPVRESGTKLSYYVEENGKQIKVALLKSLQKYRNTLKHRSAQLEQESINEHNQEAPKTIENKKKKANPFVLPLQNSNSKYRPLTPEEVDTVITKHDLDTGKEKYFLPLNEGEVEVMRRATFITRNRRSKNYIPEAKPEKQDHNYFVYIDGDERGNPIRVIDHKKVVEDPKQYGGYFIFENDQQIPVIRVATFRRRKKINSQKHEIEQIENPQKSKKRKIGSSAEVTDVSKDVEVTDVSKEIERRTREVEKKISYVKILTENLDSEIKELKEASASKLTFFSLSKSAEIDAVMVDLFPEIILPDTNSM